MNRILSLSCLGGCLGMFVFGAAVAIAAEPASLRPDTPSTAVRSHSVTYDAEMVFTVTAPGKTRKLQVWLPIPPTGHAQELLSSKLSTFPESVTPQFATEPVFGNRFAYFEFDNPQGAQLIRHKFRIKVWELRWNLDPRQIQQVDRWPDSFAPYQRSEPAAVTADERFGKLLSQIVPARRGPLQDFDSVFDWVEDHLTYDHAHASLRASSRHALEQRRGHCSDYHSFCAAMGRLLGQPTRVTYGLHAFAKSSPSHCKLEAYFAPYGWVSFDVSETQRLIHSLEQKQSQNPQTAELVAAARARLMSGFRDNTWFVQTRGTDYDLAPKASSRVPVVRTIHVEADGKPLPEPDPSDPHETTFSWMTSQRFTPDHPVSYPFADPNSLREWISDRADNTENADKGATK